MAYNSLGMIVKSSDFVAPNAEKCLSAKKIPESLNGQRPSEKLLEKNLLSIQLLNLKNDAMYQFNTTENFGRKQSK
uniref:BLTX35 n=1 Tax=Nephila pilipes TaxID=299642 RepID=A0A076KTD9_NEPPI|nr:BLTX35 [Nephila pilipes]